MIIVFMSGHGGVALLLASIGSLLLGGCAVASSDSSGGATESRALSIVTAAYPFQFVAERVAAENGSISNLTSPGAEPHDLELSPRQVGSIARADLVIYLKGFQPAVDEAVVQSGGNNVLDTSTVVPLEDHGSRADEHTGHEHDEESGGLDPHVWLDPTRLAVIAGAVADRLAAIDPEHAPDYRTNASRLESQLAEMDRRFTTGLASCERTEFITTHAAFGYLAERYGLTEVAVSGLSPDAEASPARIAEVQQEAKAHGITTIFFETLTSPAVAQAIAGDLGLRTDVLDPIEGITADSRGSDYLSIMAANLAALRKANACR
jgi:zinc transport system substrate-binding protein